MRAIIEECRQAIGPAPRTFTWLERLRLLPPPPKWLQKRKEDDLWDTVRDAPRLLCEGSVVWGCLVQANTQLFKPGKTDTPCVAMFSRDLFFDENLDVLLDIALAAAKLKKESPAEGPVAEFAKVVKDDYSRALLPVPSELTAGREVFYTALLVHRRHLPDGLLAEHIFPLLVHTQLKTAMILPARYWPGPLLAAWRP